MAGAAAALVLPALPVAAATTLGIATTIAQIADAARRIGGERVEVESLMGEGVDPHTFRPTRSDIARLVRADLVLYNGLYLEAGLEPLLVRMAEQEPNGVIAVAEALPPDRLLGHADYAGRFDPHVWMDVGLWMRVVAAARDAMIARAPEAEASFRANADAYLAELGRLKIYVERVLATVPPEQRVVVSAHDAFSYFGRAYGYEVIGIQGLSTESEAGLDHIENLVGLIVERGVKAVFVESSVASRNVRALVEGAAARGHEVEIGGQLFSDAMGAPGTYEGTYVGMLDHNATLITRALGGQAPEEGMHGRLSTPS